MATNKRKPRNKWNSLKMANRIPEVDLERKLTDIRRYHAYTKRDVRMEETKIWDELYANDRLLRNSIAKLPEADVVRRMTLVVKAPDEEQPLPYSEHYRQFIVFKAKVMSRIFGSKVPTRPKYRELYAKETAPKRNNIVNAERLINRYRTEQEEAERQMQILDIANTQEQSEDPEERSQTPEFVTRKGSIAKMLSLADQRTANFNPVFKLPSISDRFRSKEDRKIVRQSDIEEVQEVTEASLPDPEKGVSTNAVGIASSPTTPSSEKPSQDKVFMFD